MSAFKLTIKPGLVLDNRYEIVETLGAGGFATVYRARQLNIDREVAVKILAVSPTWSEAQVEHFHQRFLLEATNAASLDHPDVVTIHDHGLTESGLPFIAMELLRGQPLDVVLSGAGPMAPTRALPLFVRCLDALQSAHDAGIIHKDLKPANLFLCRPGTMVESLRILDFGISALVNADKDARLTTHRFVGTAAYCAPEYYARKEISPAVDVYQMGLVLAEMLMGRPVVQEETPMQAVYRHSAGELRLPRALLESPVGPIIHKAVSLDPKDRHENAGRFRDVLAEIDPTSFPRLEPSALQSVDMNAETAHTLDPQSSGQLFTTFETDPSTTNVATDPGEEAPQRADAPKPTEVPAAPAQKPRWPIFVALAVVGIAVAVGLGVSSMGDDAPPAPSKPAAVEPAEPRDKPAPKAAELPTPDKAESAAKAPAEVPRFEVVVVAKPPNATVEVVQGESKRSSKAAGETALSFDGASEGPWEVSVTAPKFKAFRARFAPLGEGESRGLGVSRGAQKGSTWTWSDPVPVEGRRFEVALARERRAAQPKRDSSNQIIK